MIFHLLHDHKVRYNASLNLFKFNETQTMIENNTGSSIQKTRSPNKRIKKADNLKFSK